MNPKLLIKTIKDKLGLYFYGANFKVMQVTDDDRLKILCQFSKVTPKEVRDMATLVVNLLPEDARVDGDIAKKGNYSFFTGDLSQLELYNFPETFTDEMISNLLTPSEKAFIKLLTIIPTIFSKNTQFPSYRVTYSANFSNQLGITWSNLANGNCYLQLLKNLFLTTLGTGLSDDSTPDYYTIDAGEAETKLTILFNDSLRALIEDIAAWDKFSQESQEKLLNCYQGLNDLGSTIGGLRLLPGQEVRLLLNAGSVTDCKKELEIGLQIEKSVPKLTAPPPPVVTAEQKTSLSDGRIEKPIEKVPEVATTANKTSAADDRRVKSQPKKEENCCVM